MSGAKMKREDWDSWIARLHSLGSAEELYDSDMTHSYRLTEGRLIRYPMSRIGVNGLPLNLSKNIQIPLLL